MEGLRNRTREKLWNSCLLEYVNDSLLLVYGDRLGLLKINTRILEKNHLEGVYLQDRARFKTFVTVSPIITL